MINAFKETTWESKEQRADLKPTINQPGTHPRAITRQNSRKREGKVLFLPPSPIHYTMVQNRLILGQKTHFSKNLGASEPTSECSGKREQSEQCGASKRVSSASERAELKASGLVRPDFWLI